MLASVRYRQRAARASIYGAVAILIASYILFGTVAHAGLTARRPPAHAAAYYKECGHLERFIGVVAHNLTCRKALDVARVYLAGNHHPLGFRCKRVNVNAAAGYFTHCIKHAEAVNIAPE
jgi:hypothetical protein